MDKLDQILQEIIALKLAQERALVKLEGMELRLADQELRIRALESQRSGAAVASVGGGGLALFGQWVLERVLGGG